jgi:hypothetical protein
MDMAPFNFGLELIVDREGDRLPVWRDLDLERRKNMKRYRGAFVFGAGILLLAATAFGNHLDREMEAVEGEIEATIMDMQRAQTLSVTAGTGEQRGAISAGEDELTRLHKRLKELERRSQTEHAAQKK